MMAEADEACSKLGGVQTNLTPWSNNVRESMEAVAFSSSSEARERPQRRSRASSDQR